MKAHHNQISQKCSKKIEDIAAQRRIVEGKGVTVAAKKFSDDLAEEAAMLTLASQQPDDMPSILTNYDSIIYSLEVI